MYPGQGSVSTLTAGFSLSTSDLWYGKWGHWKPILNTHLTHTHARSMWPGPTRRRGDPAQSPQLHTHLQVVGRDNRPPPWTPDVLLHLPQGLEAPPAAAPVLVQLLQQHPLGLQEAQLPVIMPTGQQGESEGLEEEEDAGT